MERRLAVAISLESEVLKWLVRVKRKGRSTRIRVRIAGLVRYAGNGASVESRSVRLAIVEGARRVVGVLLA